MGGQHFAGRFPLLSALPQQGWVPRSPGAARAGGTPGGAAADASAAGGGALHLAAGPRRSALKRVQPVRATEARPEESENKEEEKVAPVGALGSPLPIAPPAPHPSVPPRPPAAAPEEPATLLRWCPPPRQPPPGRPELPPRARGRWLSAPRAAELHRRPQQVSQAWLVGGGTRSAGAARQPRPGLPGRGPAPPPDRDPTPVRTPAVRGGGLRGEAPSRVCVSVSVSSPTGPRLPPSPPLLCRLSSSWGAGGGYGRHPRRAGRRQHFRKRNWSRENKGAAPGSPRRAPAAAGEGVGAQALLGPGPLAPLR